MSNILSKNITKKQRKYPIQNVNKPAEAATCAIGFAAITIPMATNPASYTWSRRLATLLIVLDIFN